MDITKLVVDSFEEDLKLKLFDYHGILLMEKKIVTKETEVNLKSWTGSIYFLKIFKNDQPISEFKILKK
jgi:hypothetical protein